MRIAFLVLLFLTLPSFAHEFPSADVRGFGTVSGSTTQSTIDGQPGSVLTITCEDADHAKLVLDLYEPGTYP